MSTKLLQLFTWRKWSAHNIEPTTFCYITSITTGSIPSTMLYAHIVADTFYEGILFSYSGIV